LPSSAAPSVDALQARIQRYLTERTQLVRLLHSICDGSSAAAVCTRVSIDTVANDVSEAVALASAVLGSPAPAALPPRPLYASQFVYS